MQIDDFTEVLLIEPEGDRPHRLALPPERGLVAQQLLSDAFGEEADAMGRPAPCRMSEAMAQDAVRHVDDLGPPGFVSPVFHCHGHIEAVAIFDPMRRIQWPVQHFAGIEVEALCVRVVPWLIGHVYFDLIQRDILQMLGRKKRPGRRIDENALAAMDLPQSLTGEIAMVIDLRVWRRNQDADGFMRGLEAREAFLQFTENACDQLAVTAVHLCHAAEIEPHAPLRDRLDDFGTRKPPDLTFAPEFALTRSAHLHEAVMFPWILLDQVRQPVHAEEGRTVQIMR